MAESIKIEDARRGVVVMDALVGNCLSRFEIQFVEDGDYRYLVREVGVTREVFYDALEFAQVDRFDPDLRRFDFERRTVVPTRPAQGEES